MSRRACGVGAVASGLLVAAVLATVVLGSVHGFGRRGPRSADGARAAAFPSATASSLPPPAPGSPRFPIVTLSTAAVGGAPARLYLPLASSAGRAPERYPVVAVLRAAGVDPSQYEQYAHDLAAYGLVVVVPRSTAPGILTAVARWAGSVDSDAGSAAQGLVEPGSLYVVSHLRSARVTAVAASVRAVVAVEPRGGAARVGPAVPSLVVCGAAVPASGACGWAGSSEVRINGLDPMAITNEGRGRPLVTPAVGSRREGRIAALARWTGLWLLAQRSDAEARAVLASAAAAPPEGVQVVPRPWSTRGGSTGPSSPPAGGRYGTMVK